ncbi:MAG: hypothetical protein LAP38_16195 [Acidobacteriia bacterium]|nr:hypothetical protein [Terriglobia bacterium]
MALVKKTPKASVAKPAKAGAIHLKHKDGEHHVVGLGNIRVLLLPDGSGWFAQGLEIDYAAQGESLEEAKKEFEDGLEAMVHEHIRVHGDIKQLLQVAPNEIWNLANDPNAKFARYSQVSHHHVIREKTNYEGIAYLIAATHSAGTCQ